MNPGVTRMPAVVRRLYLPGRTKQYRRHTPLQFRNRIKSQALSAKAWIVLSSCPASVLPLIATGAQEPYPATRTGKNGMVQGDARQRAPPSLGNPSGCSGLRAPAGAELCLAVEICGSFEARSGPTPSAVGERGRVQKRKAGGRCAYPAVLAVAVTARSAFSKLDEVCEIMRYVVPYPKAFTPSCARSVLYHWEPITRVYVVPARNTTGCGARQVTRKAYLIGNSLFEGHKERRGQENKRGKITISPRSSQIPRGGFAHRAAWTIRAYTGLYNPLLLCQHRLSLPRLLQTRLPC